MTKPYLAPAIGCLLRCPVIILLSADLVNALAAQPCPTGPDCYPWGAEGPAAGTWSYASKSNYLVRGFGQLALTAGTGLFLIWKAGRNQALSGIERAGMFAALGAAALLTLV